MAEHITTGVASTIGATFYNDEDPATATGDVEVTIVDPWSAVVVDAATATSAGEGRYTHTLDAQTAPTLLTATWSGTFGGSTRTATTRVEVAGGIYPTIGELRTISDISNADTYTTDDLKRVRNQFIAKAERHCGYSFVPRFRLDDLTGLGARALPISNRYPRAVSRIDIDDVTMTVAELADVQPEDHGVLLRDNGSGVWASGVNILAAYTHGLNEPPDDLNEAAKRWIAYRLTANRSSMIDERATSIQGDLGTQRLSTPGGRAGGPGGMPIVTGIPDVDQLLDELRMVQVA